MTDDQTVNNDRPTYRDLQSLYEASVVRARQLEGGQGESSGPSFLSHQAIADSISEQVLSPTATASRIFTAEEEARRSYWGASYGSQQRSEVPRWADSTGSTFASRSLTLADLRRTFNDVNSFRETTREIGEQMRFSGQPDPLTEEDKRKLEAFYVAVLKNGYARYPLDKDKISLYINGMHRKIYGDAKWGIQSEYIYIGYSQDQGSEDFAQPMYRLACISALMGITGHANKPELIALLSERLAKVMAGVYDTVVKPLATTSDSRPVRRMAWSTGGGLATWLDGAWVGLTGEPVEVGSDWIVVDTNEGPIEDGLPAVGTVGSTLTHAQWEEIKERFDRWATEWNCGQTADGRVTVAFAESKSDLEARIAREGLTGCVVDFNSFGQEAITYPIEPLPDEHPF